MKLVLFDLDNTLIAGDSDYEWALFLIQQGVLAREEYEARAETYYAQYKAGTLDIMEFLDFQLEPLTRFSRPQLEHWREEFFLKHIQPLILPAARNLIEKHRTPETVIAIVTATNSFITQPIARTFNIAHLIATIPAWENERFTGKPRGTPAFRAGKIERVTAWLESIGMYWGEFEQTSFYSDSINDLPLLNHVSHPVAVDPDDALHDYAQQHQWSIISLRTPYHDS